jgi:short-subunit dehydrogenase
MGERKTIAITGASAGIGAAMARVCAAQGYDLILIARREGSLQSLADEVSAAHGITAHVVSADLGKPGAAQALYDEIAARGLSVDGLVNNAGYSKTTGFTTTDPEDQNQMIRVMLMFPVELTRLYPAADAGQGLGPYRQRGLDGRLLAGYGRRHPLWPDQELYD